LFFVQQWFTSNWPRELWLAVDPCGVHLLEPHARSTLCTYSHDYIVNYSPSINSLMIITGSVRKQSKIILNTNQVIGNFLTHESKDNDEMISSESRGYHNVNEEILTPSSE
jgi:hypothetical protein